jgi:hypothetical protein
MGEYTPDQWAQDLDTLSDTQVLAAAIYGMMEGQRRLMAVVDPEYEAVMDRVRRIMEKAQDTEAAE